MTKYKRECKKLLSSSMLHQLLYSLQSLHGIPSFHCGARLNDILMLIKKNYETDGDVESQVKTVLKQSLKDGFIDQQDDKYILVTAVARVQKYPKPCRKKEICKARKIFPSNWKNQPVAANNCKACPERQSNCSQCVTKDKAVQFSDPCLEESDESSSEESTCSKENTESLCCEKISCCDPCSID